jgi:hypothetical protein
MAEGRMLKRKISLNEAVADLANDSHRLLFTWGIAHLDVEGRITGSARAFKAHVAPLLEHITADTVLAFFQDGESKGLIQRYEADGEWHIQYPKFAHNQNLTKSREAASKRPAPPPDYSPSSQRPLSEESLIPQPEVKGREKKGSKEKANASVIGEADDHPTEEKSSVNLRPKDLENLWNELNRKPTVSELTDERRKKAALRIRKRNDLEWWRGLFEKVRVLNKPWLTFDFLMRNDTNCLKVLEGAYDHDFRERRPEMPEWKKQLLQDGSIKR